LLLTNGSTWFVPGLVVITVVALFFASVAVAYWFRTQLQSVFTTQPRRIIALLLGLVVFTVALHWYMGWRGRTLADSFTQDLKSSVYRVDPLPPLQFSPKIAPLEEDRIRHQYEDIERRSKYHLNALVFFYATYFRIVNMVAILGGITAICLFYIANRGWTNSDPYIVMIFAFMTVSTAYYASYPGVFQVDANISANKALYLRYIGIANSIATYVATYDPPQQTNPSGAKPIVTFIQSTDDQMNAANDIAIGFDYSKVANYKDILAEPSDNSKAPASNPTH
jgi:hypothetical protein